MTAQPIVTLWHGDGIDAALALSRDLLARVRPSCVQLHTWTPEAVASSVRRLLPGVDLIVGCGVDGLARAVAKSEQSVAGGVRSFVALALRAVSAGARAIVWNAEAGWKRPPTSDEAQRLDDLIRQGLAAVRAACPQLEQWHTAYDHPSLHSAYPWRAWLGAGSPIVRSLPQVYAAPGDGLRAHRGALQAREARALASWGAAVRAGWIRPDAPDGSPDDAADVDWSPYYQLHSVPARDTIASAVRHPVVALWALPSRADSEGRTALAALCALRREGYWGAGAIERYQRDRGLEPDGVVGPKTLQALGL